MLYKVLTDARIGHAVKCTPSSGRSAFEGQIIACVQQGEHPKQFVVTPLGDPGACDYFALPEEIA